MNHSIHNLASTPSQVTASQNGKHHPMQLHHTLQHPQHQQQQQPLVNQHQQTMLQFHNNNNNNNQTLQHPYSSLHTLSQPPLPPQHHNNNNNNHHQQQQQQQPATNNHTMHFNQQQQQQYNMNSSDYSSSTYHIYDQISDLIIINQQRLERKRQQEQKRKVILAVLASVLLVGALIFLVLQSLLGSSSSAAATTNSQARRSGDNNNNQIDNSLQIGQSRQVGDLSEPQQQQPAWIVGNGFDGSKFAGQNGPIRLPERQPTSSSVNMNKVTTINSEQFCNGHGSVISSSPGVLVCKCDPDWYGERCDLSAIYPPQSNSLLTRCQLTNNFCNGNGQCNQLGRCQCFSGFFGPQCEFRHQHQQQQPSIVVHHNNPIQVQQQPIIVQQQPSSQQQPASDQPAFAVDTTSSSSAAAALGQQRCATLLNQCNGQGQCTLQGRCKCFPGFMGDSCQEHDLCFEKNCLNQGNCLQSSGECQCKFGFRGNQCEIRDDELLQRLFNCSNHGKFDYNQQKCNCDQGFAGFDCSEERCDLVLNLDGSQQQAPVLDCGLNGLFDCRQGKCICQDGYSGIQCQQQQCSAQCLRNGQCVDGACICRQGFYGKHCSLNGCPNQCSQRGECVRVLTSSSSASTSSSSSSSTSSSSDQQQQQQQQLGHQPEWRCQCQTGSTGDDCSQSVERQCDDGIDNDRDGLVDCADSECCSDKVCQNSTLCMKSPDPLDILMRKQPPPPTSSFFQRMQFLIEKFSSQIYSNPKDFNDSLTTSKHVDRASVIRGRVTYLKQGVTGVRVSVAGQINLGITLTRDGGYFDLMVNGGGAVLIEFRREPFATKQKAVRVPWNEIVLMDPVELSLDSPNADLMIGQQQQQQVASIISSAPDSDSPSCLVHNYRLMRPQIVAAPKSSRKSSSALRWATTKQQQQTSRAVILRDSGMVQQSILLPGSTSLSNGANESVSLVYISSRANEFMSTISLQLTPPLVDASSGGGGGGGGSSISNINNKLPAELKLIHLKIVIEGNLFEQLFEPQTNLTFTYAWNRRNVYRQKSFGQSTASVSVGYEYYDCKHIIWTTKNIQLAGHDLSISDIGSQWNLNNHHRYNYRDSILQRGDGQNFNLKTDKQRVVQTIMGDGYQRQTICPYCDSAQTTPIEQRLLRPQALVSAPDGSIYVGDYNLIRKIEFAPTNVGGNGASASANQANQPGGGTRMAHTQSSSSSSLNGDRIVKTVLELPTSRVPSKYSLALNLVDQMLYMSDIDRHQIYLIREQGKQSSSSSASQLVGGGVNDTQHQASSSSSSQLPLSSSSSSSSAAAAAAAAAVEENLIPVVGSGIKCELDDRANCGDGQAARMARLIEPKAFVFDLNNRMYIADGPNVRMVDTDNKIYTILGDYGTTRHTKFPCSGEAVPMHKFVPRSPQDLAMSPLDDTLYLLDDNVVYKITQDKRVQIVAGRLSHCPPPSPLSTSTTTTTTTSGEQLVGGSSSKGQQQQTKHQSFRATEVYLQSAQSITFGQNGDLFISEDDQKQQISRVLLVSPDEDTISLYAGLPIDNTASLLQQKNHQQAASAQASSSNSQQQQQQQPTVDSIHLVESSVEAELQDKQRSSNILPLNQATRALDYKFNSVSAIVVDQQGKLIVADRVQLRILSVEADLPQINAAGEFELQSPDNPDELLVFNRYGHHIATREISSGIQNGRGGQSNKYTFTYNVNTSFGQLASVSYATGNKISIYRDGPHHSVKMIETAFGGQCKLDISRNGQVHSISTIAPNTTKTNFSYHVDGGLLKQSRDQASGEIFDFSYDEFGRAIGIQHSSPRLASPVDCRLTQTRFGGVSYGGGSGSSSYLGQYCSSLIVAE